MWSVKRVLLIGMLICAVFAPVCSAGTDDALSGRDLLRAARGGDAKPADSNGAVPEKGTQPQDNNSAVQQKSAQPNEPADKIDSVKDVTSTKEAKAVDPESKTRVVHFPKDRSLGRIMVKDANIVKRHIQDFHDWYKRAEYLGEAQGDVVIPAGKMAALFLYKSAFEDLSPLSELKPDDLYVLGVFLVMSGNEPRLSEESIQHITHLADLKYLWLFKTRATTKVMEQLTKLQSLELLVPPKGLTNKGLSYVAQLNSLKVLSLYDWGSRVTNAGVNRYLPRLTKLEKLILCGEHISDAGLVCLADLPRLRYLSLRSGNFTDAGMAHVKKCLSLRIIDLFHLPITDEGVRHISSMAGLEDLGLFNTEVTDRGLAYLKSMPSLKKLNIGKRAQRAQITDAGMVHLAQINSLEHLQVSGITDKGMAHIAKLKNLKHLRGGGDSDAALQHISKLQSLEYLATGGTGFTNAGMDDLAKLTNLKDLRLFSAHSITNEGLAKLKTLKSLERLTLSCKNLTIAGLSHLNELPNIVELRVRKIKQDNSGLDISGLSKLEKLRLTLSRNEFVRDEDMACLKKLKNLRRLAFGGVKSSMITDAGIAYLKDLPNMRELFCGSPYLTDKSLSYLANMKTLNSLTILGNFTDEGLRHLEGLKHVRHLSITSENAFSNAALRRLREKLPNCETFKVMP